jgi:bifunctional DNA-binding transcriptional regulator/antitoxin component of YhaV-PrlF toxin-antitoxin module
VELAKLSRKGQLSIPKRLLKALGVEGEAYFLVEPAPEGGLLLRPASPLAGKRGGHEPS